MATMTVKNAAGDDEIVEKPLAPGRVAAGSSRPVALSTEDLAALATLGTAAGQTSQLTQQTAIAGALGTLAGAAVITDANGTIQQYLRGLVSRWAAAVGSGSAAAALRTTSASDDPAVATLGTITGAAVITDGNGTIQQYLRGLVKRWADALGAGIAASSLRTTLASDDPAVTTLGSTTGTAVITDANGTIQQYLRGLVKRWSDALGAGTAAAAIRTTSASDDPAVAALSAILAKLVAAPATEASSAAILAKIIAAPATEASLAAVLAKITADPATQTTLASLLSVLGVTTGTGVVTNANGTAQQYLRGLITILAAALGSGTATAALRTTLASNDPAVLALERMAGGDEYEMVAASQTAQVLGATGAVGDYVSHVIFVPTSVSPGAVVLLDNAISIPLFDGGTNSLSNLASFGLPVGMTSVSGAWKMTTGAGIKVNVIGSFT